MLGLRSQESQVHVSVSRFVRGQLADGAPCFAPPHASSLHSGEFPCAPCVSMGESCHYESETGPM